jgi:hypothetical protein
MKLPLIVCGTVSTNDRAGFNGPVILQVPHFLLPGLALGSSLSC